MIIWYGAPRWAPKWRVILGKACRHERCVVLVSSAGECGNARAAGKKKKKKSKKKRQRPAVFASGLIVLEGSRSFKDFSGSFSLF